ncbi:Maf family protein [Oceanisphaera avium]|uniref:Maf family protein n=1 Tax=Oceanisphaera avium TaxID=1903694 RepID=UPI000B352166|nr:nucleoside triphosphate pyrophosphatase [Oceanisphaera avium]
MTPSLVLASSSAYRQLLLNKLGLSFHSQSPDIDERPQPLESGPALVQRLAEQKAYALRAQFPHSLIIGADQVCVNNGHIVGKPGTLEKAKAQLLAASGQHLTFYTGLAVYDVTNNNMRSMIEPFSVVFRTLCSATIDRYLAIEPALDCAGAFKCEGLGISLFERMEGRDPNALIGLPLIALVDLLSEFGVQVP